MVSYYRKKSFDTQYHILHDDKINILEKLDSINDLGVTFDKKTFHLKITYLRR